MAFCGVLRRFVAFFGVLWHFVAFCGILWRFIAICYASPYSAVLCLTFI